MISVCRAAVLIGCFLICACKDETDQPEPARVTDTTTVKDTADAASPYFPVYAYLKSEIEYVDSLPVGIMKYTTKGNTKDSGYIGIQEFHKLVDEFVKPEIYDTAFARKFKETSFVDRSSGNATFMYSTRDTTAEIRRIDVVTAKGDVYDEVKSIYLEKSSANNNSPSLKKLYWKPKRNFQLITVSPGENGRPKNELIKVVWDNRE